ncbi:unnamed protein product [Protopolystoma xenopodis]|uniref:Uncharacterized protein n=1 Tax=Protopolystoma xenopodis TaxID=117903 RepID=A0A448WFH8_9PLAT|nr:unnamed protein product [Protopolystoma xenopodis]
MLGLNTRVDWHVGRASDATSRLAEVPSAKSSVIRNAASGPVELIDPRPPKTEDLRPKLKTSTDLDPHRQA